MASLKLISDRQADNALTVTVRIPPRRNGEANLACLTRVVADLHVINPDALDPVEKPAAELAHEAGIPQTGRESSPTTLHSPLSATAHWRPMKTWAHRASRRAAKREAAMTNQLTFRTENQWAYLKDGGAIDLLRASVCGNRWYASAGVTLLGLGVGLTWWRKTPIPSPWVEVMGAALGGYADNVPVESLGREHGA